MSPLLLLTLFALAAVPAWLRGGTQSALQWPLPWLATIAMICCVAIPVRRGADEAGRLKRRPAFLHWFTDPWFYLGLLFLGLLALQWYYAGRSLFLNPVTGEWGYTSPARPGWPFAFKQHEAAEMLRWFFPAWAAALAIRCRALSRSKLILLARILTLNAALMALLGIIHQQAGFPVFPFTAALDPDLQYFASFGYRNHAASYFTLMAALAAGLAFQDFGSSERGRPARPVAAALMGIAFVLNLAATQLSFSRAGIIMGWILAVTVIIRFMQRYWPELTPTQKMNAGAGGLAVVVVVVMAVYTYGGDSFTDEMLRIGDGSRKVVETGNLRPTLDDRVCLAESAITIWRGSPVFGVGGWGFRYLLPFTLAESERQWMRWPGRANVHNDPLQFLAEFGIAGAVLLALAVVILISPFFRRNGSGRRIVTASPLCSFALLGIGLVFLHSLIDLPFRGPAILIAWTQILAIVGTVAGARSAKRKKTVGGAAGPAAEHELDLEK